MAVVRVSENTVPTTEQTTHFVDAVRSGLLDVEAGRVLTTAALRKRLSIATAKAKKTR